MGYSQNCIMQRIREINIYLIEGVRHTTVALSQQQLNNLPCLIPSGNIRVSQSFAVMSKYTHWEFTPIYVEPAQPQHPCYTISFKAMLRHDLETLQFKRKA